MVTETRLQDTVTANASEARETEIAFSAEEIELACDAPVTVYGRMQP